MYDSNFIQPGQQQYQGQVIVPGSAPHGGKQPLSQEQIEILRAEVGKTEWKISDVDILKSKCTHKDKQGNLTIVDGSGDKVRCTICGEEFHLLNDDLTTIQSHVDYIIDALQTTKTTYLDIPDQLAEGYFQIIPMLQKLSILYKKAADNMAQHSNSQTQSYVYGANFNAMEPSSYAMMGSIMAGNNGYNAYGAMPGAPIPGNYVPNNGQFVPQQPSQWAINPMTGMPMAQPQIPVIAQPMQNATQPTQAPQQVNVPPVVQQPEQQVTQTKTFNV